MGKCLALSQVTGLTTQVCLYVADHVTRVQKLELPLSALESVYSQHRVVPEELAC
jgi:hypothetical protein